MRRKNLVFKASSMRFSTGQLFGGVISEKYILHISKLLTISFGCVKIELADILESYE